MENIDNMAEQSLKALARDNLSDDGKKKLRREIIGGALAVSCVIVGIIYSLVFPDRQTISALLYTAGFLIEAIPIFFAAIKGMVTRDLTNAMEILVAIAVIACYFNGDLILAVLIPLILNLAHFLEERSIMGGRDVIDGLRRMQQSTALLITDAGAEITVDVKTLKPGQHIAILPGMGIPIDGRIISGSTNIDQKSLTGEPLPAHAAEGTRVYAGTVNIDGRIVVEVEKEFVDTSFSQILAMLERSERISIPESRLIDRFMRYYIPFVLSVAAAVSLITRDVGKAIAILVVSCPCGQMLVSSAPMIAALSAATKRGILIKNSKFIEELTEIDTVIFDKTGTLTHGELTLVDSFVCAGTSSEELISAAASVAAASMHPVSRAIMASAPAAEFDRSLQIREISGMGMEGRSADGKRVIHLGNRAWISGFCPIVAEPEEGLYGSVSYVEENGSLLGYLVFGDTVRDEAAKSTRALKALGITETVMLTGDRPEAAGEICRKVGIDTLHAQLLPQDKYDKLRDLQREHHVLAVGDGINDALALREADVGISMGAMGSDLAIQSSDIALMNNDLENIPFVVKLARRTRRIIYQNLALSIGISVCMITLSAFGVISALWGSILHNFGAFAVLINSSRLIKGK